MDDMESTADSLASFNSVHHLIRFLILMIATFVFAVIVLLALKCILVYKHMTERQHDREKAIFTV